MCRGSMQGDRDRERWVRMAGRGGVVQRNSVKDRPIEIKRRKA